jgi:hypothetical protein
MSIDFNRVHELRQQLFYHLSSAAAHCMNNQHNGMVHSIRSANAALAQIETETTMDKAAGA